MSEFYCRTPGRLTHYRGADTCVTIPDDITVIGRAAFCGCFSVKTVILHDRVEIIEPCAFEDLEDLESVQFGTALREIGECAFSGTGLRSVRIPGSVKTISRGAFLACPYLTEVFIGEGCQRIEASAFSEGALEYKNTVHIHLPTSISDIEDEYAVKNRSRSGPNVVIYSGLTNYLMSFYRRYYYDLGLQWQYEPGEYDIQMALAQYNDQKKKLKKERKAIEKAAAELDALKAELAAVEARLDTLKGLFKRRERKACEGSFNSLTRQIEEKSKKLSARRAACTRSEKKIAEWDALSMEEKRRVVTGQLMKKKAAYEKEFEKSDKHVTVFMSDIMARMSANEAASGTTTPDMILMPRIDVSDM